MSDEENADPLETLFVSADEVDRERIATVLRDRLAIDRDSAEPVILPGYAALDSKAKMLALLLVRKARVLLGLPGDEAVSPSEAARLTGVPSGTVRRMLPELVGLHMASQPDGGGYLLSNAQVPLAVDYVTEHAHGSSSVARRRTRGKAVRSEDTGSGAKDRSSTKARKQSNKARASGKSKSPTSLVSDLVNSGFFGQPRTLSEVQTQLKDKTGHQVPLTSLSPIFTRMLRSGSLDRERSEGGTYAYTAAAVGE
jgi:hypothetical protein